MKQEVMSRLEIFGCVGFIYIYPLLFLAFGDSVPKSQRRNNKFVELEYVII